MGNLKGIIDKEESNAINTLRMVCVLAVVMIHSNVDHLVPSECTSLISDINRFLVFVPTLPILFVLSGYLFFQGYGINNDYRLHDYVMKIKKRIKTLYLPYVIWCIIGFLFGLLITHKYFFSDNPLYYLKLFTGNGIFDHPSGRALWYIKSLICFSFLSPFYFQFVKLFKHITPFMVFMLIYSNLVEIDNPIVNPYILLGVYLCYYEISLNRLSSYFSLYHIFSVFLVLTICDFFFYHLLYFRFFLGLILFYCIVKRRPLSKIWAASSTFIYFSHMYFSGSIRNFLFKYLPEGYIWYVLDMILTWGLTILICSILYYILYRFAKPVLSILTGDRC